MEAVSPPAPDPAPAIARTVTPPIIVIPPKRPSKPSGEIQAVTPDAPAIAMPRTAAQPITAPPPLQPVTSTSPTLEVIPPIAAGAEPPRAKFVRVDTDVGAAPAKPRTPAPTSPPRSNSPTSPPRGVITRKPPTMPPPAGARAMAIGTPPAKPLPPVRPSPPTTPPPAPANPHPFERPPSVPPLELAPPEFDAKAIAVGTEPPRRKAITVPPTTIASALDATLSAKTSEELIESAIRFAAGRWRAVLLFEIRDRIAAGEAGYGQLLTEDVVVGLALPLAVPSAVSLAVERGGLVTDPPDSLVQERLDRLLGVPRFPAAMPIVVHGKRRFVVAVGDPIAGDTDTAMQDLEKLAIALGAAYTKLSR